MSNPDPRTDPASTDLRAALARLLDLLDPADGADKPKPEALTAAWAAVRDLRAHADDPDPVEAAPPNPLADPATVRAALDADDPNDWLRRHALDAGGAQSGPEALTAALAAGDRGEQVPADVVDAAAAELQRRERAALRMRRAAVLDADPRPRLIGTPPQLESAGTVTNRIRDAIAADNAGAAAHGRAEAARLTVTRSRRAAVPLSAVTEDRPVDLLSVVRNGRPDGAVLSAGAVAVLAGAGGSAKSTLALHLAMAAAGTDRTDRREAAGLSVRGGPVVLAAWEDHAAVLRDRAARLAEACDLGDAMRHVHLLPMSAPVFGPADRPGGGAGLYNARPEPLPDWAVLWRAVAAVSARYVILDPVLSAFAGESNAAAPVREFLSALGREATARSCGVLLVAHSTKETRRGNRADDPPDPFTPGMVGGSSHWTDGVRGALTLTPDPTDRARPVLAVAKANWGPAYMSARLVGLMPGGLRYPVGFEAAGDGWQDGSVLAKPKADKTKANGAAAVAPIP